MFDATPACAVTKAPLFSKAAVKASAAFSSAAKFLLAPAAKQLAEMASRAIRVIRIFFIINTSQKWLLHSYYITSCS